MDGLINLRNAGPCISSPDLHKFLLENLQDQVIDTQMTAAKLYGYMNTREYPKFRADGDRKTYFRIEDFIEMFNSKENDDPAFAEIAEVIADETGFSNNEETDEESSSDFNREDALNNLSQMNILDKTMVSGIEIDGVFFMTTHDAMGNVKTAFEIPSSALAMAQNSEKAKIVVAGMVLKLLNR
jgi:hypothetical protein